MNSKEVIQALHSGKRVYGTLYTCSSPLWMNVIDSRDMDCVFLDTEHMPMDWHELGWMCHAFRGKNITPIVRIPRPDPFRACRIFDNGAQGIVAAYVETAQQVNQLRSAAKLRPLKGKKLENILAGKTKIDEHMQQYMEKFNEGKILLVNIESTPALENLDEILEVPGLDGVLIGPHDLSCSLGVPEDYDHPKMEEAISRIISKARAKNIGVGVHNLPRTEQDIKWAKKGLNLILRLADTTFFQKGLRHDLNEIRKALGDKSAEEKGETII